MICEPLHVGADRVFGNGWVSAETVDVSIDFISTKVKVRGNFRIAWEEVVEQCSSKAITSEELSASWPGGGSAA
jgi:hypothetical protein